MRYLGIGISPPVRSPREESLTTTHSRWSSLRTSRQIGAIVWPGTSPDVLSDDETPRSRGPSAALLTSAAEEPLISVSITPHDVDMLGTVAGQKRAAGAGNVARRHLMLAALKRSEARR